MAPPRSGKRRASRSPSDRSGDAPLPYETEILRRFQPGEESVDSEGDLLHAVTADAEEIERHYLTTVARHQGLPPLNLRPTAIPTTEAEREDRRNTLRDHIRVPHAIDIDNLNRLLTQTGWDVIRAAILFRREEQIARITDPTQPLFPNLPPRHPTMLGVNQNRGHGRASVPESRRAALATLYIQMQQAGVPTTETNHTVARFLRRHNWDFRAALQDYLSLLGANRDLSQYRAGAGSRSRDATQYQEDERLAEFLNLVSIDSIHSARILLQRFNFDLSRAYDEYVRLGRVPFIQAERPRGKKRAAQVNELREVSVEYGPDNSQLDVHSWAKRKPATAGYIEERVPDGSVTDANPHFPFTTSPQPENLVNPPEYGSKRAEKHVIDPIPRGYRPQVNCPNPIFLRTESISRGKYKMSRKKPGSKIQKGMTDFIRWDDNPRTPAARHRDFDWRSVQDVAMLNKTVAQESLRAGQKTKAKPLGWHALERDFLWRKFAEETEKTAGKLNKLQLTPDDLPPKISDATKGRIAAEVNAKFEGRQVVDGVDMGAPRPHRTKQAINTARGRIQEIMDDFHTGFQDPRKSRRQQAAEPGEGGSEGEGEGEDKGEGEDEGESGEESEAEWR